MKRIQVLKKDVGEDVLRILLPALKAAGLKRTGTPFTQEKPPHLVMITTTRTIDCSLKLGRIMCHLRNSPKTKFIILVPTDFEIKLARRIFTGSNFLVEYLPTTATRAHVLVRTIGKKFGIALKRTSKRKRRHYPSFHRSLTHTTGAMSPLLSL